MSKLDVLQELNRRGILPPDKQPLYDEAVKRGLIQDDNSLAEAARPILRAARSAASGTIGTMGDLAQMATEPLAEGAGYVAEKMGLPQVKNEIMKSYQTPASDVIKQGFDKLGTAPRNDLEKIVDSAGEFASGGALLKGTNLATNTVKGLADLALSGAGSEIARQSFPDSPLAPLIGAVVTPSAPGAIKELAQGGGRALTKAITPKNVNEAVLSASKETGIPLPPSAKVPTRMVKFLESRSAQSGLSGDSWDKLTKQIDDRTIDYVGKILDDVSPSKSTPLDVGRITQKAIQNRQRAAEEVKTRLYGNVRQNYGDLKVNPQNTLDYLDRTIPDLEKTLAPSAAKTQTIAKLKEMRGNLKEHPDVATLVNTKADLSDIANFETTGGVKSFLKPLGPLVDKDILSTGNPNLIKDYNASKDYFKNTVMNLRNDLIDSIQSAKPEMVLSRIQKPSDVFTLQAAAGQSAKMKRVVGQLKRAKLEEILTDKFIKEGTQGPNIEFGRAATIIPKEREMIKALAGETNLNKFEALKTISQGISEGKSFYNYSKSGNVAQDVGLVITSVLGTFTGNPSSLAVAASPYVAAKVLTNEKLMNKLIKLSREAKTYKRAPNLKSKMRADILVNSIMQDLNDSTQQNQR
jgi:hypothetical protein